MLPKRAHSERGILPMKNSDMKIIAIILSIALFFTIITSNAVSIASVVLLALDGTGTQATETVDPNANNAGNQGSQAVNNNSNNTVSNNTTSSTNTNNTQSNNTQTNNTQNNTTNNNTSTDANKDNASNAGADDNAIMKDPLAAYQKAAKDIHDNGSAGYTKKGWQAVEGELQLTKLNSFAGALTSLVKSFMTEESAAEEKINEKGSDDAKNRMPISNCSPDEVASATAKKLDNGNYEVVVVMKDQVNPSYSDTNGLALMSREFLDFKDVQNTVATDETVKKLVKSLDGTITYKAYTITAEMTADGKFVNITHYCRADIVADVEIIAGSLGASGALSFNAKYYDFKY